LRSKGCWDRFCSRCACNLQLFATHTLPGCLVWGVLARRTSSKETPSSSDELQGPPLQGLPGPLQRWTRCSSREYKQLLEPSFQHGPHAILQKAPSASHSLLFLLSSLYRTSFEIRQSIWASRQAQMSVCLCLVLTSSLWSAYLLPCYHSCGNHPDGVWSS